MAENSSAPTEPLDVRRIKVLAHLMKRYDLASVDLSDGQVQIRLRRRGPEVVAVAPASRSVALGAAVHEHAAPSAPISAPAEPPRPAAAPADSTIVIESPMVGTYYTSRAPDAPPLVSVGSVVHPNTIVGIIEAMKVFTDIPAGVSGTIVEALAKNAQPVEYGQPLFRVRPA
ncbi:MAG: acetyl-CoA carboxylase biotin carboxyl carrier protein [Isosphaeraceae bacterium]